LLPRQKVIFTKQQEEVLEELFHAGAVLIGDEVRARFGLGSPIYFNLREPLLSCPSLLWKVGGEFARTIRELAGEAGPTQCVVGIPDTATPLAVATALYASRSGVLPEIVCAALRKEGKQYPGMPASSWIGPKDSRYEYNLIDDVVASGETKRAAAATMQAEGIVVRRVIVLFDREQGDGLRLEGYDLHAIFTVSEALTFYVDRGLITREEDSRIREFLSSRRFTPAT
jgi:uridine monophosphate synthetase